MTTATITSSAGRFTGKIVDCLNWDAATRGERAILHVPCCRSYRLDSLIGMDLCTYDNEGMIVSYNNDGLSVEWLDGSISTVRWDADERIYIG